uniref:Uncharacterized protein n=1 Tax=Romanomermis culicivorax TaxID=13658 RepID=A0A915KPE1_ROMCU
MQKERKHQEKRNYNKNGDIKNIFGRVIEKTTFFIVVHKIFLISIAFFVKFEIDYKGDGQQNGFPNGVHIGRETDAKSVGVGQPFPEKTAPLFTNLSDDCSLIGRQNVELNIGQRTDGRR